MMNNVFSKIVVILLTTGIATFGAELLSPDGTLRASITLQEGHPAYSLSFQNQTIVRPSRLSLSPVNENFSCEISNKENGSVSNEWKQVWGERAIVKEHYTWLTQQFSHNGKTLFSVEWRLYNEGFAFRYRVPAQSKKQLKETSCFAFPEKTAAWGINHTEGTFPVAPIPLPVSQNPSFMMPLTVALPNGLFASVFEAYTVHYPRAKILLDGTPRIQPLGKIETHADRETISPWRAILVAHSAAALTERATLVLNLNPPCALTDTSWIKPGISLSNEMNCPLKMSDLIPMIDAFATNGIRYLQLDWGWYGTEWPWTEKDIALFKKTNPNLLSKPNWLNNTKADPYCAASGFVPYRPDWKWGTDVDLNIPKLVSHLKDKGMGLCLYMHGDVLRAHDLDKLFATYQSWGLAGLKPGFVQYGNAEQTDWIRKLIQTAAQYKLWLCIHDAYVPDGMERTYPNLMLTEGGGGQEGNHPVRQDVTHPFTRCLAGPFDFTPYMYQKGKTIAHSLAFAIVYPGGSIVLRGGKKQINSNGPDRIGEEWDFIRHLPMNWDESKTLSGKIGDHIVVARKQKDTWHVGGMSGIRPIDLTLKLEFLSEGKDYHLTLFRDGKEVKNGFRRPERVEKIVRKGDSLQIRMEEAGGFVARLEEKR